MHNSQYVLHADTPEMVLKSVFTKYDTDGNGDLDIQEFSRALSDLGVIDEQEQHVLFHLADADNGGSVSSNEFIKLVKQNEFDHILGSHEELEFIYQTHKTFQQYDADGNGESLVHINHKQYHFPSALHMSNALQTTVYNIDILRINLIFVHCSYTVTWEEFYSYLSKHGYSHQHISQHWYFMDQDHSQKITFDEFWKGYKAMAEAAQKQQDDGDIDEKEQEELASKKKKKVHSRVIEADELELDNSADVLNAVKGKLRKSSHKMNKREFQAKVGKVVDDDDGLLNFETTDLISSPKAKVDRNNNDEESLTNDK